MALGSSAPSHGVPGAWGATAPTAAAACAVGPGACEKENRPDGNWSPPSGCWETPPHSPGASVSTGSAGCLGRAGPGPGHAGGWRPLAVAGPRPPAACCRLQGRAAGLLRPAEPHVEDVGRVPRCAPTRSPGPSGRSAASGCVLKGLPWWRFPGSSRCLSRARIDVPLPSFPGMGGDRCVSLMHLDSSRFPLFSGRSCSISRSPPLIRVLAVGFPRRSLGNASQLGRGVSAGSALASGAC